MSADARTLETLFDALFAADERTRLIGGASEPVYRPAISDDASHRIIYRADYFASALHEVAHWCIAGPARRRLPDYGYWYAPAGRGPAAQRAFEAAEARPQGLEWLFAQACGTPFVLSVDNVGAAPDRAQLARFAVAVAVAARGWQRQGPAGRAGRFVAALREAFPNGRPVHAMRFAPALLLA